MESVMDHVGLKSHPGSCRAAPFGASSASPNSAVAQLLVTDHQRLSFDRLITLYDQIAACVNTKVCSATVTSQLYGRDIQSLFQNWYGYVMARRAQLGANDYACELAGFLGKNFSAPDPGCLP